MPRNRACLLVSVTLVLVGVLAASAAAKQSSQPFLDRFSHPDTGPSTVPANGDVNPYGVVVVQHSVGNLTKGDVLVSNFNDSTNAQGKGTTIVEVGPNGTRQFAHIDASHLPGPCPGGVGLTTALTELHRGLVIVGSLPTSNGQASTAQAGCLLVLDSTGKVLETISGGPINGPWDMATAEQGNHATLFVTNVLNNTIAPGFDTSSAPGPEVDQGSVVRIQLDQLQRAGGPTVTSEQVIASRFPERTDPSALVVGPTGAGLASNGTLYVADTDKSRIAAIPNAMSRTSDAGDGQTISSAQSLNGPLGLLMAPNGDIVTANGGDGNLVETTPGGQQVATKAVDPSGGDLFGITLPADGKGVLFVDDGTNTLNLFH